jgi:integrase
MALWTVLLMRDLRRSEACALAWDDLAFANRTLRISKSLHRVDGHLQAMPPKTRPSNRTLPLPARCAYALAEHHRRLQELHGSGPGRPWHPTDYIFGTLGAPRSNHATSPARGPLSAAITASGLFRCTGYATPA